MKKIIAVAVLSVGAFSFAHGQLVSFETTRERSLPDGREILRSSVNLPDEQESIFLALYNDYVKDRDNVKTDLATLSASSQDINERGNTTLLGNSIINFFDEGSRTIEVKRKYYEKMRSSFNGSVALQFLQSEALLQLLQRSQLYEQWDLGIPKWNPDLMNNDVAKREGLVQSLGVASEDTAQFRKLYDDYEFSHSRIVGYEYFFFEQYVDNVAFLTPAQSYKLGREFLQMENSEISIQKSFFDKFSERFGGDFAARFLAAYDYFSTMEKLTTWSDSTLINSDN